jgi:hypothetical protein
VVPQKADPGLGAETNADVENSDRRGCDRFSALWPDVDSIGLRALQDR